MLLARQQTSENEQTKAYVRTTVIGMGGASRNHRYKKFSRATVFVASVTRPSKLYSFNRGVWPGEEARPGKVSAVCVFTLGRTKKCAANQITVLKHVKLTCDSCSLRRVSTECVQSFTAPWQ